MRKTEMRIRMSILMGMGVRHGQLVEAYEKTTPRLKNHEQHHRDAHAPVHFRRVDSFMRFPSDFF